MPTGQAQDPNRQLTLGRRREECPRDGRRVCSATDRLDGRAQDHLGKCRRSVAIATHPSACGDQAVCLQSGQSRARGTSGWAPQEDRRLPLRVHGVPRLHLRSVCRQVVQERTPDTVSAQAVPPVPLSARNHAAPTAKGRSSVTTVFLRLQP